MVHTTNPVSGWDAKKPLTMGEICYIFVTCIPHSFLLSILFFSDLPRGGIVMLSIYGTYDGKVVRPLVKVNLPPNVRAIITFLSDEGISGKEKSVLKPWVSRLAQQRRASLKTLEEVQRLLSTVKGSLAHTVIEEREERL